MVDSTPFKVVTMLSAMGGCGQKDLLSFDSGTTMS